MLPLRSGATNSLAVVHLTLNRVLEFEIYIYIYGLPLLPPASDIVIICYCGYAFVCLASWDCGFVFCVCV